MFEMKAVNLANLYLFLKTFQCPNLERLFVQVNIINAFVISFLHCHPVFLLWFFFVAPGI